MTPLEFIEKLRHELEEINQKITKHPFILDAVQGKLGIEKIRLFIEQQHYVALNDAKALAIMYSRSDFPDNEFFLRLLVSHQKALERLNKIIHHFNIDVNKIKPISKAISYTHFLFHLAFFGSIQEQVIAIIINFPIFIESINKLGKALREKYQFSEVSFFEEAKWDKELEFLALKILEKHDFQTPSVKNAARLIQEYELEYWDCLYS